MREQNQNGKESYTAIHLLAELYPRVISSECINVIYLPNGWIGLFGRFCQRLEMELSDAEKAELLPLQFAFVKNGVLAVSFAVENSVAIAYSELIKGEAARICIECGQAGQMYCDLGQNQCLCDTCAPLALLKVRYQVARRIGFVRDKTGTPWVRVGKVPEPYRTMFKAHLNRQPGASDTPPATKVIMNIYLAWLSSVGSEL